MWNNRPQNKAEWLGFATALVLSVLGIGLISMTPLNWRQLFGLVIWTFAVDQLDMYFPLFGTRRTKHDKIQDRR